MPLPDIEHAISSAQSNKLIEWQTGKLFAYLMLHNSRINMTFRNHYKAGPSSAHIIGENTKTFIGCFLNSYQISLLLGLHIGLGFHLVHYQLLMTDISDIKLENVR